MKIHPIGADLFHMDRRWTGRHEEANSRSWQYCERAYISNRDISALRAEVPTFDCQ